MAGARIQLKRATAAAWAAANTVLYSGEIGLETDTNKFKIGNGSTAFNSLSYFNGNLSGSSLNDLSDVTITSATDGDFLRWNGTAWINDAVNLSTDTIGSYVESLVAGTGVTLTNNSGEGATPTVAIGQSVGTSASVTFGQLTVNGQTNVAGHIIPSTDILYDLGSETNRFRDIYLSGTSINLGGVEITSDGTSISIPSGLSGNADTATTLQNTRTISLSGDVSGSVSFNGSSNVDITATVQPNSVALGTDTTGNYVNDITAGTGVSVTHTPGEGTSPTIAIGQAVGTSASVTFAAVTALVIGNASTATTLQTARNIAGQSFDGSANISIAPTDLTGVTSTAAELNILDGATLSVTELNYVDGVTSAIQTQLDAKAPLASPTFTGSVTVPTPINDTDAATKLYADAIAAGVKWHDSVETATAAALPNTPTYNNGTSGVGATLTASANARLIVDGANATTNDRVLVKNQANAAQNGIYDVTAQGSVSAPYVLTRSSDHDGLLDEVERGDAVYVANGSANVNQGFIISSNGTGANLTHVLGTDDMNWSQFTGTANITVGTGITKTGNTLSIGQSVETSASVTFSNVTAALTGNASTATTLQTARNIAGQPFDGSANISISPTDLTGVTSTASELNILDGVTSSAAEINILDGATLSTTELNYVDGVTSDIQTQIDTKAPLASPTFTGTVTLPDNTVALGTKTTGDYVSSLVAGTGLTLTNNSGESATPTIAIGQDVATSACVTFANVTAPITGNVTGNLTGNVTGNVAGNVTGNVVGNLTGNVTGDVSGSSGTVTSIGTHGLDELSDVTAPSPSSGQFLKWNGSAWVPDAIDLSTDTSGNFVSSINAGTGVSLTNGTAAEAGNPTINIGQAIGVTDSPSFANMSIGATQVSATGITYSGGTGLATVTAISHGLSVGARITVSGATQTGYNGTFSITSVPDSTTFTYAPTVGPAANNASGPFLIYVAGAITFEGSTDDSYETTIVAVDPTADRIISLPNATTQLVGTDTTDTLTNKTLTSPTITGVSPVITLAGDLSGTATFTNLGNATLTATIAADSVALGTDTTGNYVANLTQGTGVTITNNSGEGATPTIAIGQNVSTSSSVTFDTITVANLVVTGNQTSTSQSTLNVSDSIITLNSDVTGAPTLNAAVVIERGTSPDVDIRWNESLDRWEATADGSTYAQITGGSKMTISETPPSSPSAGDFWFESDSAVTFVYYDSYWIEIGASGIGAVTQAAAPANAADGQMWFKSTTNEMFVYYDGAWILVNSSTNTGDVEIASIMGAY